MDPLNIGLLMNTKKCSSKSNKKDASAEATQEIVRLVGNVSNVRHEEYLCKVILEKCTKKELNKGHLKSIFQAIRNI